MIRRVLSKIKKSIYKKPKPALNNLDKKLAKYLDFEGGFFIEAGANDGYTQSNTYYFEKSKAWRGVLVEGIPQLYKACKKNRPNSKVFNCALVADGYAQESITMHYADLMSMVDGAMPSQQEQTSHISKGLEIQRLNKTYSVEVSARTLESVLDSIEDLPDVIDLFSLDVEGYELNVLKGINLKKYRPKYILVEARYFDEVDEFLTKHEYSLIEKMSVHDYLYKCD